MIHAQAAAVIVVLSVSVAGAQKAPAKKAPATPTPAAEASRPAATTTATDTGVMLGTFVSSRIDGKTPPVSDVATDDQGTQYLIEFAELVLSLKPAGEFRAALRYLQTLAAKGQRLSSEPQQKMTVYGAWHTEGANIRFVPDPKRGGEGLRILAGIAAGRTITVPFDYQNGRVTRRANVILIHDPRIF